MRALGRRLALGLVGEGMQSAFHFAVNLALVRVLSAADYGLFAIVFTLGSFVLTYVAALAVMPANVIIPRVQRRSSAGFHDVMFGSVALVVSLAGALAVGIGLLVWAGGASLALAAGTFVGLWPLRGYVRGALYARRDPAAVARSDLAFTLAGLVLGALLLGTGPQSDTARLVGAFAVLASANAVGIAGGLLGRGRPVRVSLRRAVRRRYRGHWSMLSWSLVGVTTSNVQSQFQTVLVAGLAGPAAYAPIAAGLVLMAPLRLGVLALISMVQPDFSESLASGQVGRAGRLVYGSLTLVALACAGYGVALWLGFDLIRSHVFARYPDEPMGLILALAWAVSAGYLSYTLPKALLESAGAFRDVAIATLASALIGILCVSALIGLASPAWSLAGVVVAESVTLVHFWRRASRIIGATGGSGAA